MAEIGIYFEPEAYSIDTSLLMGRQSAGAGFLRAYAKTRPAQAWCYAREKAAAADFAAVLGRLGCPDTRTEWVGVHNVAELSRPGLLYRPDPGISADAWRRLQHAAPAAYSLCGITHTTAHQSAMGEIAHMLSAPLEPWDALICTSVAVRASVQVILDAQADYLTERLGARRFTLPHLPVIPLGVHADDFTIPEPERATARAAFGLDPAEAVFLFVGRLSAFSKAHPVPMFLGLEACAADTKVTLIQAGWFETEAARGDFEADARALCPSVRCLTVDGRDPAALRRAWAAADVFTSLSDSIQETFGLTPVEAMASGLPVVVSDWDGYKDTVRDGLDGFRIPTVTLPPTTGQAFANRYDAGVDDYHAYVGIVGQFVAVDVAATAAAYRRLALDPALRRQMGASGRAQARDAFDWPAVFARYDALWADLAERRNAGAASGLRQRSRPDAPDPFTLFAGYPTAALAPGTVLRRGPGATPDLALRRRALATVRFAEPFLPNPDLIEAILSPLDETAWVSFDALRQHLGRHPLAIAPAIVWLAKMGVLELRGETAGQ